MGRSWSRIAAALAVAWCLPPLHAQDPPTPTSRALVIGAEAYPEELGWTPLRGPVPDARAMADALVERGGFERGDVRLLLDGEATRAGILAALDELIARATPGDLLFVSFAGHGSQVLDLDGDELDGLDETIVPIDPVDADGKRQDIRDDEIADFIRRANAVTDDVVLVFDCCNSGTNVRGAGALVARQAPNERVSPAATTAPVGASEDQEGSGYLDEPLAYVALSACRSFQQAFEVEVEPTDGVSRDGAAGSEDGEPLRRGVFTTALVDELLALEDGVSYRDLIERVRDEVRRKVMSQTPVIEGPNAQRALLGGRATAQDPFFGLWPTRNGWDLQAGRLAGLVAGTELVVCDGRAPRPDAQRTLGHVRIRRVGETASPVTWLTEAPDLLEVDVPLRAFTSGFEPLPGALSVALEGGDQEARVALTALIEEQRSVRVAPADQAAMRLRLDDGRSWQVLRADGRALPLQASASDGGDVRALVEDLAHLGRAATLRHAWQDRSGGLDVAWSLEIGAIRDEAFVPRSDSPFTAADERITTRHEERFRLTIENRSEVYVWVSLVVVAPDGEVFVVAASPEDEPLPPSGSLRTATYRITLPEGAEPYFEGSSQRLACIATRRFHDLGRFAQSSIAQRTRGGGLGRKKTDAVDADAIAITGVELEVLPREP